MNNIQDDEKTRLLLEEIKADNLAEFLEKATKLTESALSCKYVTKDRKDRCRKCGSFHILRDKF